jgi:pantoate--beta-alanine ligase
MEIVHSIEEMLTRGREAVTAAKKIVLVPTMGFLHEGHLVLMREGRKRGDILVVSIFVNPTQFGIGEDYEDYPRDLEGDARKAATVGVDTIFAPSAAEMYPSGYQTFVTVENVTQNLCGASRPTHFRGVTTVVGKLFNIVQPHVAVFGEKDYQQLIAIRQMVKDLNFDIQIVGMPTVREPDGVAMSSRNKYLSPEERGAALCLTASLDRAEKLVKGGERSAQRLLEESYKIINDQPLASIDYVTVCDPLTLEDVGAIRSSALMALAVRIGKTRLIDNRIVSQ